MKKFTPLLIVLIAVVLLAGCQKSGPGGKNFQIIAPGETPTCSHATAPEGGCSGGPSDEPTSCGGG